MMKKALQAVVFCLFFTETLHAVPVATLDWTVAETLIALGEKPLAVGDKQGYKTWVQSPALPDEMLDLGIRLQPNIEQVFSLKKQKPLFINSSFYAQTTPMLEKVGQVALVDFYTEGNVWHNVVGATYRIADLIGDPQSSADLVQRYLQNIGQHRPLIQTFTDRPIALVQFADSRHLRIYGQNSLFGAVLDQLGFTNVWQQEVNNWGFENIEITRLAKLPSNTRLVVIKPYPNNIETALKYNTLWQKLALTQDPLILPAVWTFGGIPSAQRFADTLTQALLHGGEKW